MSPKTRSFGGRIAFVEDYDELLAQYLVHGVDVWVNNPIPPMEASGTSGMKAGLNGVPQLSILDGWWIEGYNGKNGWAFEGAQGSDRDAKDAAAIYEILEKQVVPLYYDMGDDGIPRGWVKMMKETMKRTGPISVPEEWSRITQKSSTRRLWKQRWVLDKGGQMSIYSVGSDVGNPRHEHVDCRDHPRSEIV